MYFNYGETETAYLSRVDSRMQAVIDRVGHINRPVDTDLFSSVIHHIIGQQISTKAQATIWQRMQERLGTVDPDHILEAGIPELQTLGMTFRKAEYITDFAERVHSGTFDPEAIRYSSDAEAIAALSALKGIGIWTAEMILLFCMQRPDIFSYDDLAIQRGLRMVYMGLESGCDAVLTRMNKRGQSVPLGRGRRCAAGADRSCTEKEKNKSAAEMIFPRRRKKQDAFF